MYKIDFYRDKNGRSDVLEFITTLRQKLPNSKDARIQYTQLIQQMQLLEDNGTRLPANITKHIDEDICELRPGHNRVFYFCWLGDSFVMLHHFRKKTNKTPREIDRAKAERDEYIRRHK